MHVGSALLADERDEPALAALWFARAARLTAPHDAGLSAEHRLRASAFLRAAFRVEAVLQVGMTTRKVLYHPGGDHLLVLSRGHEVQVWDLRSRRRVPVPGEKQSPAAAWSPDGKRLALAGADGSVEVLSFPALKREQRFELSNPARRLLFSPDGRWLAAAGRHARVWDARQAKFATPELAHPAAVLAVAFSPAGDRLVTADARNLARAYAVPAGDGGGAPLFAPLPHHGNS